MKTKTRLEKIIHYLFHCPTFWRWGRAFHCPGCGKGYRCYWDGHDVLGYGKDYCGDCATELEHAI